MHASYVDFDSITKGLRTKSDKIRALAREGVATADIARYLNIRYQHARNVLVASGLHSRRDDDAGSTEFAAEPSRDVGRWVRIDAAGWLQLPVDLMKVAGLAGDEPVHVRAGKDGIEVLSRRSALERAHQIASQFVPDGTSLVDELIAERRREASKENE
jgi:hypothetical protein